MRDVDLLDEMIAPAAFERPQQSKSGKLLVNLCEPQEPNSMATIHNLPPDARIIKIDRFPSLKNILFKGDNDECKRADYVIISEERQRIIYIEMKLTKGESEPIVKQLHGAQCVMKYCREIGRAFWGERDFLANYKSRFVYIAHTNIRFKDRTRISKKAALHDSPEKHMQMDYPNRLEFNELAG